jgi:predicted exporter
MRIRVLDDFSSTFARLIRSKVASWVWLVILGGLALHLGFWWSSHPGAFDSDLLALLPEDDLPMVARQAQARLTTAAERRVIMLVGGSDLPTAIRAGDAYYKTLLGRQPAVGRITYSLDGATQARWRTFFVPYRYVLLSKKQQAILRDGDGTIAIRQALLRYYSPLGLPDRLTPTEDPFQLFSDWQLERARTTRLRVMHDRLVAMEGERHYVTLTLEMDGSAFDQKVQARVLSALEEARAAAEQAVPGVAVMAAGIVLHAAEATVRAQQEMLLIGVGSFIGIALLALLAFRSLYLLFLAQLPLLVGSLAALSICSLLFDRIHVVTLVFGTSLLGVAMDYSLHYLCHTRREDTVNQRIARLLPLAPGMSLAWLTTVLGYLAIAIPPFPVLRQMATFSVSGLLFAWLAVLLWLPRLTRGGLRSESGLVTILAGMHHRWPRVRADRMIFAAAAVFIVGASLGVLRVQVNDDIRLLQNSSQSLIEQQRHVMRLTGTPNPAQFLLVEARTPEAVLQAEEAAREALDRILDRGLIASYQAVSQWVPSVARQREDYALLDQRMYAQGGWLEQLARHLGLPASWLDAPRKAYRATGSKNLHVDEWLTASVSEPFRHQWLGQTEHGFASVILLHDIQGQTGLEALRAIAQGTPGVAWVDKLENISSLLGAYRQRIGAVVGLGYLLVLATLIARYRRAAWRVIAPTVVASVATCALFGWVGITFNLFTVLALLLVLGIGIDYGIYLYEEREDATRAWVAVSLSAASTLLSVGLLAFSWTPALQIFGLTMLCGVGLAWLLTPSFNST